MLTYIKNLENLVNRDSENLLSMKVFIFQSHSLLFTSNCLNA